MIICTDKLLDRWRAENENPNYVHLHVIEEIQQLLIDIFGLIGFGYDLHALDNDDSSDKNELAHALHTYIDTTVMFAQLPEFIGRLYLLCNLKYRRARRVIDRSLNQMIEQELQEASETKAERKMTSFITSLITSMREVESTEMTSDNDENKKGIFSNSRIAK